MVLIERRLHLNPRRPYLLLGPRRTGKSTFLHKTFPDAMFIDLLKSDVFFDYHAAPSLLRERFAEGTGVVVLDEVQRVPELVHEVHWLIEHGRQRFILCGSSARKLRRHGVTNLAGRLASARLFPLSWVELPEFDLPARIQHGCLPPIVFSDDPAADLRDYCGEYLREEIQAEGLVRNLPAFSRFLEQAALSNGGLVAYATIARECGVSAKTVQAYFQILEDTLLGVFVPPWTRSKKRRAILTPKFYFFDCGIPNTLLRRRLSAGTPEYGVAFEQLLVLETLAAAHYDRRIEDVRFWRAASGYEVDLLLNEDTAVEFKSGRVHPADAKGLRALREEMRLKRSWLVCTESAPRRLGEGIEALPWQVYLERVWAWRD
jgi:predicted AAA+ superfamily ATPase